MAEISSSPRSPQDNALKLDGVAGSAEIPSNQAYPLPVRILLLRTFPWLTGTH